MCMRGKLLSILVLLTCALQGVPQECGPTESCGHPYSYPCPHVGNACYCDGGIFWKDCGGTVDIVHNGPWGLTTITSCDGFCCSRSGLARCYTTYNCVSVNPPGCNEMKDCGAGAIASASNWSSWVCADECPLPYEPCRECEIYECVPPFECSDPGNCCLLEDCQG